MTIEATVILLFVAIASIFVTALPIIQNRKGLYTRKEYLAKLSYEELLTEYERVVAMIRDLDEDHNMGKIPPDIYYRERETWAAQGVILLQRLEKKGGIRKAQEPTQPVEVDEDLDHAIEEAIAAYRKARSEA